MLGSCLTRLHSQAKKNPTNVKVALKERQENSSQENKRTESGKESRGKESYHLSLERK
jgi:hypothetical protein